jgi:hypothetical protein
MEFSSKSKNEKYSYGHAGIVQSTTTTTTIIIIIIIMPKEQKGACSGTKGCKDHLLLSKTILQECKRKKTFEYGMD